MSDATCPLFDLPSPEPGKACPEGGIYRITGPDAVYIGSSDVLTRRLRKHKTLLRTGSHHNYRLQSAWDLHGEDAFTFEVIEPVGLVDDLIPAEQRHLDTAVAAGPVYNLALDVSTPARGLVHTLESRLKMSESIKASMTPEALAAKSARVRGHLNPVCKLSEGSVREICRRLLAGAHPNTVAAELEVSESTVYQIRAGKIWTHIVTPEMVAAMMAIRQKVWDKRTVTEELREHGRALGLANKGRPNSAHAREVNSEKARGEGNPKAKLTEVKAAEIKWLLASGARNKDLAATYGVGLNTIHRIKTGESWGYVQPAQPLTT